MYVHIRKHTWKCRYKSLTRPIDHSLINTYQVKKFCLFILLCFVHNKKGFTFNVCATKHFCNICQVCCAKIGSICAIIRYFFKYLINNCLTFYIQKKNVIYYLDKSITGDSFLRILVYPREHSKERFLGSKILLELDKRIFRFYAYERRE